MIRIDRYEVPLRSGGIHIHDVAMRAGARLLSAAVEYIGSDLVLYAVVLRALADDTETLVNRRVYLVADGIDASRVAFAQFVGTVSRNGCQLNVFVDP